MKLNGQNALLLLNMKSSLEKSKREHSVKVAIICGHIAKKIAPEYKNEAIIAGLLHDIGKSIPRKLMLNYCMKNNIPIYQFEFDDNQSALHGKISADMINLIFCDEEDKESKERITKAIIVHVAGETLDENSEISILDKILFVADNVDPKKKDAYLYSQLINGEVTIDECIKKIVEAKLQRASEKDIAANPFLYELLRKIDKIEDSDMEKEL